MNTIPQPPLQEVPQQPTNGVLIDLLDHAEVACSENPALCLKHVLTDWFQRIYPNATSITRPSRFETAIRRIAAPAKPSIKGDSRLVGEELIAYRQKEWVPKHHPKLDKGKYDLYSTEFK